jgi:GNAT superfamily N-acetyltransferase
VVGPARTRHRRGHRRRLDVQAKTSLSRETPIQVRWATIEDARAIAAVHVASWRAAYRGILPDEALDALTLDGRERDWRRWLSPGGERNDTLVAERDGTIVAFCTLKLPAGDDGEGEDVAEVPALYAHPNAFGTGAGDALMTAAIEAMRGRGYREAVLWMLEGNGRAEAFYERRGWGRDGGARPSDYPGITYESEADRPLEVRFRRML